MTGVIETERLILRSFTAADAPAIHAAVYGDPEAMRHVGAGLPHPDLAATEAALREYLDHERAHGYSFWAVVEQASGALIGDAGLYRQEGRGPEVEVGYTLGRRWWGRGYATEAARACLEAAFTRFGLDEVVAVADPANAASLRVLEKAGMAPAGRREAYGREHAVYRTTRGAWPCVPPPGRR